MRILHLIPRLEAGGAERQLGYLALGLARLGHEVHVAHAGPLHAAPAWPGVVRHGLSPRSSYDPLLVERLVRLMRRLRPDVVQTWILQMDILGGLAARISRVPWVLREPTSAGGHPSDWRHWLRARLASGASAIVANSHGGRLYWEGLAPKRPIFVVPNGLPLAGIDATSAAWPLEAPRPGGPLVLYAGRLASDYTASKNLETWLRAMAHASLRERAAGLVCGDGPMRPKLERVRRGLGLDGKVLFAGRLPGPDIWRVMKLSAAYLTLSEYEGCPNAVIEAMACGLPLVLSDIPAHREIADETCAVFVDRASASSAAEGVRRLLDDHGLASRLAREARRRAETFGTEAMSEGYEKIYERVTADRAERL